MKLERQSSKHHQHNHETQIFTKLKLIVINRFGIAFPTTTVGQVLRRDLTLLSMPIFRRHDCITFFILFPSSTHIQSPFKRFCLPFKSSFIDENTCFCGFCVCKKGSLLNFLLSKGGRIDDDDYDDDGIKRRQVRAFPASNSVLQLCSIEWSTKANENWFSSVWDFLLELARFSHPFLIYTLQAFARPKNGDLRKTNFLSYARLIDLIHKFSNKLFVKISVCFIIESILWTSEIERRTLVSWRFTVEAFSIPLNGKFCCLKLLLFNLFINILLFV